MPSTTFTKPVTDNLETAMFEVEKFLMTRAIARERVPVCGNKQHTVRHYVLPDGSRGQFEAITRNTAEMYLHIYHDSEKVSPILQVEILGLGYKLAHTCAQ